MVEESNSAGITSSSQGVTVQEEHTQRGGQRTALITGFENMVNNKKLKFSLYSIEKIQKRHMKLEISIISHNKKMLNCFHAHWPNLQQDKY